MRFGLGACFGDLLRHVVQKQQTNTDGGGRLFCSSAADTGGIFASGHCQREHNFGQSFGDCCEYVIVDVLVGFFGWHGCWQQERMNASSVCSHAPAVKSALLAVAHFLSPATGRFFVSYAWSGERSKKIRKLIIYD